MGTCCTHRANFEDILSDIIEDTKLKYIKFETLEKDLIELSLENRISRSNFSASIAPTLYKKNEINSNFHEKIFENIIFFEGKKDQNIYHILLVLFIFLSPDNKNEIQDLYKIFASYYTFTVKPYDSMIEYENFIELLSTYIENCLYMLTYIIGGVLLDSKNADKRNIDRGEINYMMNKIYTEENIAKYIISIKKSITRFEYMSYKKFEKYFSQNLFFFDYKSLRVSFIDFLRKSEYSELDASDISIYTNI
jgi:hypothetical protein